MKVHVMAHRITINNSCSHYGSRHVLNIRSTNCHVEHENAPNTEEIDVLILIVRAVFNQISCDNRAVITYKLFLHV